jgi:hypothetical protein
MKLQGDALYRRHCFPAKLCAGKEAFAFFGGVISIEFCSVQEKAPERGDKR